MPSDSDRPTDDQPAVSPTDAGYPAVHTAFEQFVDQHYQAAYRFAFSLAGNHNDACDLTQQAFYIAQTKGHQLRDPSKGKQWLFTVLHREFLSKLRNASAHPETTMEFAEAELPRISVDNAIALDSKSALAALHTLDVGFKAPLTLFYIEQLSYKEIAEALEIPIGTVMSRLARGKTVLRQVLEQKRAGSAKNIVPLPSQQTGGKTDG
ncbi:MAG: RNA polymerase sigma factor [Verrucomicrobiota bacterium]|nr:RNA polymerase sigma factor [Verrucomicrobiota bacterium]